MRDETPELEQWIEELAAGDPLIVERSIASLRAHMGQMDGVQYRGTVEALCSLFYVDTADRPDLERALDEATELLAEQGARVVPILLAQMEGSDIKSHLYLARTLGKIGGDALPRLRDYLATEEDPYSQSFALYALGKIGDPDLATALPEILGGLMNPDKEVRDSAARTLGKLADVVPPERLTPRMRREMFDALLRASRYHQAPVRAKAFRSMGKMAAATLLDAGQAETLAAAARGALGESDEHAWDNAFIVRKEARGALRAIDGR